MPINVSLLKPLTQHSETLMCGGRSPQSMQCKVGLLLLTRPRDTDLLNHRLRHQQQVDAIHLDAESLQPRVSGGGEGDVPNPQGALPHIIACVIGACSLCKQLFGVGSIPWSPLARGFLTRPLDQTAGTARGQSDRFINNYNVNDGIAQIIPRCGSLPG